MDENTKFIVAAHLTTACFNGAALPEKILEKYKEMLALITEADNANELLPGYDGARTVPLDED